MTTQEKIQKIREECIKVNPEIVELKFGCVLKRKSTYGDRGLYTVLEQGSGFYLDRVWVSSRVFGDVAVKNEHIGTAEEIEPTEIQDKFEIIGRDITPQDILTKLPYGWYLKYTDDGYEFVNMTNCNKKNFKNEYFLWRGKRLEDQTDERINIIYNLIENK